MKNQKSELLNPEYIKDVLLKNASWAFTHNTGKGYLGFGMLHYSFVYTMRAKVAVCLGSGGGFIPRLIRQAQRDLGVADNSRTILIDANNPEAGFGTPDYLQPNSFLRTHFADIEFLIKTTRDAACMFESGKIKIDYLHIDADHTFEGTLADYETYRPFMRNKFLITIHDTRFSPGVVKAIEQIRSKDDVEVIDFNYLGYGLVMIKPNFPTKKVANPALKAAAFLKHPVPHTTARLQKIIHKCKAIFKKRK